MIGPWVSGWYLLNRCMDFIHIRSISHYSFVSLTIRTDLHTNTFDLLLHLWRHLFMCDMIDQEVFDHLISPEPLNGFSSF
jgi:hypothetical protein